MPWTVPTTDDFGGKGACGYRWPDGEFCTGRVDHPGGHGHPNPTGPPALTLTIQPDLILQLLGLPDGTRLLRIEMLPERDVIRVHAEHADWDRVPAGMTPPEATVELVGEQTGRLERLISRIVVDDGTELDGRNYDERIVR